MRKPRVMQYKRWLRYMFLGFVPLIILWILIIGQSRQWALSITEQSSSDMLDKDATLIDQRFSAMANSVYLMMNDASINELLVSSSYSKPLLLQSNERELESLIGQYISDPDGIAIIYIIASNYSFAFMDRIGLPSMVAPENVLCAEKLRSASGKIVWMPTAGFDGFLSLGERYSRYFQDFEAFTLGVQMNLAYVKYGYLHTLADEQPFVLISILPSIFDQWLTSEHLLSDTTYTIYDADRALVYASADIDAAFDLEQLPLAKNQSVSVTHMPDKRGVDNIVCSRMLEETGWIITSYTPVNQAFLYFGSYISVASLVVLVITALIVGISVVFSTRSITRPLNILSAALKQTAVGNYAYRITDTSHPDYLDTFMLYNSMNEHIAQLIKENYETKLSEKNLEIQVINMQFNPHFLYNTLNVISLLALANHQEEISDMLGALSFMMRYSVKTPSALVPLSQDLAYIDSYIVLMKLRGGNDFTYEKEVDDALMDYQAPKFLLQPFVENAILHGFSADGGRHLLRLTGHVVGQSIVFTVEDNGCGMDSKDMETLWRKDAASIGISNTDRRIRLYYGDAYGVTITSEPGKGTTVTVRIPYDPDKTLRPLAQRSPA